MPNPTPRIAIVEDEHSLRTDLSEYLGSRGFQVSAHHSAEDFYAAFPSLKCDLVLLDIGLPGESGLQVAQWLRQQANTGIVMLTAFKESSDHLAGLLAGADAYLVKNTPLEVIEATCWSVLRRLPAAPFLTAPAGLVHWQLVPKGWLLVGPNGAEITLTRTELVFLQPLMRAAGQTVSRTQLLLALAKTDTPSNQRNLENHASRLRRKVQTLCDMEIPLRTSYNQGYTFAAPAMVDDA